MFDGGGGGRRIRPRSPAAVIIRVPVPRFRKSSDSRSVVELDNDPRKVEKSKSRVHGRTSIHSVEQNESRMKASGRDKVCAIFRPPPGVV